MNSSNPRYVALDIHQNYFMVACVDCFSLECINLSLFSSNFIVFEGDRLVFGAVFQCCDRRSISNRVKNQKQGHRMMTLSPVS